MIALSGVGIATFRAPQFGVWASIPPATDNPAARRPVPPPPAIRERLRSLRFQFASRAARG